MSPAATVLIAFLSVAKGALNVPAAASLPAVETTNIRPVRTVKLMLLLVLPATFTTNGPVTAFGPSCTMIFVELHSGYAATAPPPTLTVEEPRLDPKLRPTTVTNAPRFCCPPEFGALTRSVKKIEGLIA